MGFAKPSDELPRLMIRLPHDVKDWLAEQARQNASSQASEIVRSVRERMHRCAEAAAWGEPSPPMFSEG